MESLVTAMVAAALSAVAAYAQYRIPYHTAGEGRVTLTRAVLLLVGVAFGYVGATASGAQGAAAFLIFLIGFGLVHVPAAIILFVKRERGAGRS